MKSVRLSEIALVYAMFFVLQSIVCRPIHLLEKFPHKFTFLYVLISGAVCLLSFTVKNLSTALLVGIPVRSTTGFEGDCKSVVDGFLIQRFNPDRRIVFTSLRPIFPHACCPESQVKRKRCRTSSEPPCLR